MTHIKPAETVPQFVRRLLWVLAGLSLIYYAWIMLDLVTHPLSPGNNPGSIPYLFRWMSAAAGTFTVVVALFIMRRVRGNINGQLLLFWGVGAAGWSLRVDFGSPAVTGMLLMGFASYFFCVSFPALVALIFHYPTGQAFPPRLSGWVWGLLFAGGIIGLLAIFSTPSTDLAVVNPVFIPALTAYAPVLQTLVVGVAPLLALISLGLRYRAAGVTERLQIKWLLWLAGLGIISTIITPILIESIPQPTAIIVRIFAYIYWQAFPAVAIGIALLRHRLWDIDLIIRRTLVYGVLSGLLGLVYFGSVVLLRQILGGVIGDSSIAIVISTLLIALLFSPLRRALQEGIDRRFFRQKYDAARALAEFSHTTRDDVELEAISGKLITLVGETVQPESLSLWMKPRKDERLKGRM